MSFVPDQHHRRSIRLQSYDYTQGGAYFVTVCAYRHGCIFGEIVEAEMQVNDFGRIVLDEWLRTGERANVELDVFIVMPNHIHGVLVLIADNASNSLESQQQGFGRPVAGSLGTIVVAYKSATARRINRLRNTPGAPVWQRNYFEHIIRNQASYEYIYRYVQHNASILEFDRLRPEGHDER